MPFNHILRTVIFSAIFALSLGTQAAPEEEGMVPMHGAPEPKVQLKKEHARPSGGSGGSSPLLLFRGGSVLKATTTTAIFWGAEWNNASFAKDKITGLDSFFYGFSGSRYATTGTEFYDNTGFITPYSTYKGHVIDTSAPPRRALKVSQAVAEACKIANNNPDPNGVYFIYTSTSAGQVNYCAWHSWGNCSNGAPIQVAYMPNLDGIAGCDPQDNQTGHSQGLAALANVTAHELLEAITDPRGQGWVDSSGLENADKCAWSFPSELSVFSNGSQWKLQMEWSNAAYNAGTGLPNRSGQKACIY